MGLLTHGGRPDPDPGAMMGRTPLIERACELARAGQAVPQIRKSLKKEGYTISDIAAHLDGATVTAMLKRLAMGARNPPPCP